MPPPPASGVHAGPHTERDTRVQRISVKLHGGGPLITLRNERGDIIIR